MAKKQFLSCILLALFLVGTYADTFALDNEDNTFALDVEADDPAGSREAAATVCAHLFSSVIDVCYKDHGLIAVL